MFLCFAFLLLIVELSVFSYGHFNVFFANCLLMYFKTHIFWGPM